MSKITFTKYTSTRPLSKEYSFVDNVLNKKANVLSTGSAETLQCSFKQFYQHLIHADERTAFGYGVSKHNLINITSNKSGLADDITFITRSKRNYVYPKAPGILMLDYDPSPYCPYKLTVKKFLRILKEICPSLKQCAVIVRDSVSAGVHVKAETKTSKGFHVYIPVLDASDIPRFGKLLHRRLWQEGYGYIALSKDGKMYERSLIDVSVFSPERLDFTGKPIVHAPLHYDEPDCLYMPGDYFDTTTLRNKSLNQKCVNQLITQAKKRMLPEQKRVQHDYDVRQYSNYVAQGYTSDEAQAKVVKDRANAYQILDESHVLHFADGTVCTISEAIQHARYGESLADPIEGVEYGTTTAQFILRHHQPFIRSMAHGGRDYRIVFTKEHSLNVISANPGSGKTVAICKQVKKHFTKGEYVCIVLPTDKLMMQYCEDLVKMGIACSDICLISSKQDTISVGEQLSFALRDDKRLIIITHVCLQMMKKNVYQQMSHYHVYIDEVFYPHTSCKQYTLEHSIKEDAILKKLCHWEPIDRVPDAYVLQPKNRRLLNKQLKKYDGKHSINNADTNEILNAVKDHSKIVIISKMNRSKDDNYCIAIMYNCTHLQHFKSCTIASAFVQQTELYHWLSLFFNMIDVTEQYANSMRDLSNRIEKLTLIPFIDRYTKHVRDKLQFCKVNSSLTINSQRYVNRIIKECNYFDDDTLRVLNNDDFYKFGACDEVLTNGYAIKGTRISSQVHGQNSFQHLNSAVIVAAFNLYSYETAFFKKLLPFYDSWLERNVFTTIQCFMRTSLRNKESNDPVYVMVPDQRTCDAVVKLYNNLPSVSTHCLTKQYYIKE